MYNEITWFVGDANGDLWQTLDSGANWTEITLPVIPTLIEDIQFFDETVGYLAITGPGVAGQILRTTDGGATWDGIIVKAA
jgi:photosystem II stability/assembly factor-like uncharacterized protein